LAFSFPLATAILICDFLYTRLTVLFGAFLLFKLAKDMEIEMLRETEMVRDMYMEIVGDGDS
jgi:hypothetical protein